MISISKDLGVLCIKGARTLSLGTIVRPRGQSQRKEQKVNGRKEKEERQGGRKRLPREPGPDSAGGVI